MTIKRKYGTHQSCRRPRKSFRPYWPRKFLLTRNEAAFFRVLVTAIGGHYLVSCKVRLADIVACTERDWQLGHANRIAQKHIDFVIVHAESSRIVAAIELDDRSHDLPARRRRDVFVNGLFRRLQIKLIRVPASWSYSRQEVEQLIATIPSFCRDR